MTHEAKADNYVLVPGEPTPEMLAAAALAVLPMPPQADMDLAAKAAAIVAMGMETRGSLLELTAVLSTMPAFYRAMIAAAPKKPDDGLPDPEKMCGRCYDEADELFPANCQDPSDVHAAVGMHHCGDCGAMVMAGMSHPRLCRRCRDREHPAFEGQVHG
jgi:hypothetical protein